MLSCDASDGKRMRTGVEQTRSQKEKAQREESKGDESPPPDAPKPSRVEHKRLIRLRSYLVRGYAETTDARVDRILRLPNGACWTVLAYWREAA